MFYRTKSCSQAHQNRTGNGKSANSKGWGPAETCSGTGYRQ